MHTHERVRGVRWGNTDCLGEEETPIRITRRNQVKNMAYPVMLLRVPMWEVSWYRNPSHSCSNTWDASGRVGKKICWCTGGAVANHLGCLPKTFWVKKSWNMVMGTSQGVGWHFVGQKLTNPLTSLHFCVIRSQNFHDWKSWSAMS